MGDLNSTSALLSVAQRFRCELKMKSFVLFCACLVFLKFEINASPLCRPRLNTGRAVIEAGCDCLRAGCYRICQLQALKPGTFVIDDSNLLVAGPIRIRGCTNFKKNVNVQSNLRSCGAAQTDVSCGRTDYCY